MYPPRSISLRPTSTHHKSASKSKPKMHAMAQKLHQEIHVAKRSSSHNLKQTHQIGHAGPVHHATPHSANHAAKAASATQIVADVLGGKSISTIAQERDMNRDEVIASLKAGGMTVTVGKPGSDNGDVLATRIAERNGRTVTEYYDFQHDSYHTRVDGGDGVDKSSPVRDGMGRKETHSFNAETGTIKTRLEDDLGSGKTVSRQMLPNGTSVETTTTQHDGLETIVVSADGRKIRLSSARKPGEASTHIKEQLAEGKSINEIASAVGLTCAQLVAELKAAGIHVKSHAPRSANGDVQTIKLVDAQGDTKATYHTDFQHGERTVVTSSAGKTVTTSEDGNGRTSRMVRHPGSKESSAHVVDPKVNTQTDVEVDKEGRTTTTTQEAGKSTKHKIKPGDSLSTIAARYGVTIENLLKSNPQIGSPSDIIRAGDSLAVGRKTVEVEFGDYKLTTHPDGSMILRIGGEGRAAIKIDAGTLKATLAKLLIEANPDSRDTARAKQGRIIETLARDGLEGESLSKLADAAKTRVADRRNAVRKYPLGPFVAMQPEGKGKYVDLFDMPPQGNAPSGGKWIPVKVSGFFRWVDPMVAKAITAENVALARFNEAQAGFNLRQALLDFYSTDPAYKNAMKAARNKINHVLEHHRLEWKPRKAKRSPAEAKSRLAKFGDQLKRAQDARAEFQDAQRILNDVEASNKSLRPVTDPSVVSVSEKGSKSRSDLKIAQSTADNAELKARYAKADFHLTRGDKFSGDYLVNGAELDGIKRSSKEFKHFETFRDNAGRQLELSKAYDSFYGTHADATKLDAQAARLEKKLLDAYNERNPHILEKGAEHKSYRGKYYGHLMSQVVQRRGGQVWVVNHFEKGKTEYQLTAAMGDKSLPERFRNEVANKEWQSLLKGKQAHRADGFKDVKQLAEIAAKDLNQVILKQLEDKTKNLDGLRRKLQKKHDGLLEKHDAGSVEAPKGTLPADGKAVQFTLGGHKVKVAPDVAKQIGEAKEGIDLAKSGKAIWVEDGASGRWMNPELAVTKLDLARIGNERSQADDLMRQIEVYRNWHKLQLKEPNLLIDKKGGMDKTYLEKHEQATLESVYQPRFKQLIEQGFGNKFERLDGAELRQKVAADSSIDTVLGHGHEAVKKVIEEIREVGGKNPEVCSVRLFHVDDGSGIQDVTLFAVRSGDSTRYVDVTGKSFSSLGDFQDNNAQFNENGLLVAPRNLEMRTGKNGSVDLDVVKARNVSVWEKAVDPVVGITTGVMTLASFVLVPTPLAPFAPIAATMAYGGAAYLGARAGLRQYNHISHGGEWTDGESAMNLAGAAATLMPIVSSGARTAGLYRFGGSAGEPNSIFASFRGSIGAAPQNSNLAKQASAYITSGGALNKVAWGLDMSSVGVGAPLLATTGYELLEHGDQMSGLELTNAITGLGSGTVGTGLGIRGLRRLHPTLTGPNRAGVDPSPVSGGIVPVTGEKSPAAVNANLAISGAPERLVSNWSNRTFTSPDHVIPADLVYTSGKDAGPALGGREGTIAEQIERFKFESRHSTRREIVERYGVGGVPKEVNEAWEKAQRSVENFIAYPNLPDLRFAGQIRIRANAGAYFDTGSPTLASVGFGLGTRTKYGKIVVAAAKSFAERSWSPLMETLGQQGVVSMRSREYRNVTLLQAGLLPVSYQTAFPIRASDALASTKVAVFSPGTSGYEARIHKARIVGKTPNDKEATVVELSYSPSLKFEEATLTPGEKDFFGVPAKVDDRHVALQGSIPHGRLMTEFKAGLRFPIAASHSDTVSAFPRIGFELRPEAKVTETVGKGDILSRQAFDQFQSAMGAVRLKLQFTVKDAADAEALITALDRGDNTILHDMAADGRVDSNNVVSFVEGPAESGMRLSAIPGKKPRTTITLLTGEKVRKPNPESMVMDVLFNDKLPGINVNLDGIVTSASYKVKKGVLSLFGRSSNAPPQPRSMPGGGGNVAKTLYGGHGAYDKRYTLSIGSPSLLTTVPSFAAGPLDLPAGMPIAATIEARFQYKRSAPKQAKSVQKNKTAEVEFQVGKGLIATVKTPQWLANAAENAVNRSPVQLPKGAQRSLAQFLDAVDKKATAPQRIIIDEFRSRSGDLVKDEGLMRKAQGLEVIRLLESLAAKARRGSLRITDENGESIIATRIGTIPKSRDNILIGSAAGFSRNKTHVLVRDPETGEAIVMPRIAGGSGKGDLGNTPASPNNPGGGNIPVAGKSFKPARPLGNNNAGQHQVLPSGNLTFSPAKTSMGPKTAPALSPDQFNQWQAAPDAPPAGRPVNIRTIGASAVSYPKAFGKTSQQTHVWETNSKSSQPQTALHLPPFSRKVPKLSPTRPPVSLTRGLTAASLPKAGKKGAAAPAQSLSKLSTMQISELNKTQLSGLPPKILGGWSEKQLRGLSPDQLLGLRPDQIRALSLRQVTTFRSAHREVVTPDQARALNNLVAKARKRELKQALATFGTMAAASTLLWTMAPRPWALTGTGVAFGIRGSIFTLQSLFPNATAKTTRFGRTLNGIGGFSFAVSTPAGLLDSVHGKDLGVNVQYTLGAIGYGIKSSMEAFTQRPMIRNITEHFAGPLYVGGSIVYGLESAKNGSTSGAVAGSLIAIASTEFWASAKRGDKLNREPLPVTDEEITAAAASDRRWERADRVSLGVGFGLGMGLFSWLSLKAQPWNTETVEQLDLTPSSQDGSDPEAIQEPREPASNSGQAEKKPKKPSVEKPQQLVVLTDGALVMRSKPHADARFVANLKPGTLVQQKGEGVPGSTQQPWMQVEGFGFDGHEHDGWVRSDSVKPHPKGAQTAKGRINPQLEERGHSWVEVASGDTIRGIIDKKQVDLKKTVVLNLDHLLSMDTIFPGDRVYLPSYGQDPLKSLRVR